MSKHRRRAVFVGCLVAGIALLAGGYHWSGTIGFCSMCHEMAPFIEGFNRSKHAETVVTCAACHIHGTPANTARAKLNGFRTGPLHIKRLFTGDEPIWISDWGLDIVEANCISCHKLGWTKDKNHLDRRAAGLDEDGKPDPRRCTECHNEKDGTSHPPSKANPL